MELHAKVSHKVWVFDAFKYFQLISSLLDGFVIIWLKSYLYRNEKHDLPSAFLYQWVFLFFKNRTFSCATHLLHSH